MQLDEGLEEALSTLGEVLSSRGLHCRFLIAGGSGLLLLGMVDRPTADVDILAAVADHGYEFIDELPEPVAEAVRDVGDGLGLGPRWVNTGPAGLVHGGLPDGLAERVEVRRYGGLEIHVPGREDYVCFKLYAAVDLTERSKHFQDLLALSPSRDELLFAARWTRSHDPSPGFASELRRLLALLGVVLDDAEL